MGLYRAGIRYRLKKNSKESGTDIFTILISSGKLDNFGNYTNTRS
jgi:hypothetical protein